MNLNQMYSQIEEELQVNSDDSIYDFRFYYDLIINTREAALRNEYNRLRTFDAAVLQTLPCVELEIVDSNICCDAVITNCNLLRTKHKLPRSIELHQQSSIRNIRPNNLLGKTINLIDSSRIGYLRKDGVVDNQIFAFIYNDYLYLYSLDKKYLLIDSVTIQGVFSDPLSASEIGCGSNKCITEDDEFPLTLWMWETLVKPIIVQKLLAKQVKPQDNQNNAKDDKTELTSNTKENERNR
jgi:hypothetical protein